MIKLKSLNNNSIIGVIAPASCEEKHIIDTKINNFKTLGFNIKKSDYLYSSFGYLAGSDESRAYDLNSMFADTSIDAIICFRGGFGSIRMAQFIDMKILKNNPKIFCGYSDITLLLNYIYKTCNFPTFHSPMINSNFNDSITKNYFINLLTNKSTVNNYNLKELCGSNYYILNKGNFKGVLVGGNLSTICSTIGTPYELSFKNSILFIEDVNESPYVVDRMLSQLIFCGKLKSCVGVIIGHFTNCNSNNNNSFSIKEILTFHLSKLNIPIIFGFPIGHDYPNITLPIGGTFSFNSTNDLFILSNDLFAN